MMRITLAALALALPIAAQTTAAVTPLLAIGDSVGEGDQSNDASLRTQPYGHLNVFARQAGLPFSLPLIKSGPLGVVGSTAHRSRLNPNLNAANLSVSGATVHSLLNERADGIADAEVDLILSPRTGTQIEVAEAVRAPFVICWIGNNDVLNAITAFDQLDGSQLTPVAEFQADYAELIRRLKALGGKVMLANIPDVTQIGFLLNRQDLVRLLGSDFGLPEGSFTTIIAGMLIKLGIDDGSIVHNPAFVLDAAEVQLIRQRGETFNQIIASEGSQAGMPVVDIHKLFNDVSANPPVILGVTVTNRFLGGMFSLDGVHPSNFGYAVFANAFIQTANGSFQTTIPYVSPQELLKVFLEDPFVDLDGDLVVRGRPLAGLLETIAPFVGISGDVEGPIAARSPRTGGAKFMQEYLALTGKNPQSAWSKQDAMAALRHVFVGR